MQKDSISRSQGGAALAETPETDRSNLGGKYLTFALAGEEYGLEILKVREIIGLMDITPVPRAPEHIRGVINLRGKIIPVIDLRKKFGMPSTEDTDETCIIVVDVTSEGHSVDMGILVDSVSEVRDIVDQDIDPPPSFGSEVDTNFILGMAKADGAVKILLAIEKALSRRELALSANGAIQAADLE